MTALKKYQRLECFGLWRQTPHDQRRDVHVRLGEATLILVDPKSGTALSHWSLPAVEQLNRGTRPPVFGPGLDSGESLELNDPDMIAALETVHSAVRAALARPGRLRRVILGGMVFALIAGGAIWLPGALVRHTASVVPVAQRAEIGQRALDDLARVTGAACNNPFGLRALATLAERVFGPVDTPILYVMPEGVTQPLHLPGGLIVLPRRLLESAEGPEAAAGAALIEALRAKAQDPMLPILDHAGLTATFQLLTTADLPKTALDGYGEVALRAEPTRIADDAVLLAFKAAQIPASPYALAADPLGKPFAALIDGDPYRGLSYAPLIPDDDWVALQGICDS
jgi:hypothetical protein